jgi:hypothetical protein
MGSPIRVSARQTIKPFDRTRLLPTGQGSLERPPILINISAMTVLSSKEIFIVERCTWVMECCDYGRFHSHLVIAAKLRVVNAYVTLPNHSWTSHNMRHG